MEICVKRTVIDAKQKRFMATYLSLKVINCVQNVFASVYRTNLFVLEYSDFINLIFNTT